jgi:hypothetical protein
VVSTWPYDAPPEPINVITAEDVELTGNRDPGYGQFRDRRGRWHWMVGYGKRPARYRAACGATRIYRLAVTRNALGFDCDECAFQAALREATREKSA